MFSKVVFFDALPMVFAGIRIGASRAVKGMVVAELLFAVTGLGGLVMTYSVYYQTDKVLVVVVVLSIIGVLLTSLVQWVERRLAPWTQISRNNNHDKKEEEMSKNRHTLLTIFITLIILSLLLPACQGASKQITIAYGSNIDPADIADLLGIDEFAKKNSTKVAELTEDSGVVAGLIKGDVQIGNIGLPDAIKAIQMGVPLKIIFPANMAMEFVLIGQPGIKTVEDLKGKKVAYHAPGSGTEISPRLLVRNSGTITENDVEWIILPESPNRAAAMQSNRIDVTALEFADVLTLQESGKAYDVIASFADVAPEAISSVWITTENYANTRSRNVESIRCCSSKGICPGCEG